jgi:hypothetical protein
VKTDTLELVNRLQLSALDYAESAPSRGQRLTLSQHREIRTLACWIALLIACIENDSSDRQVAESTRQAALPVGKRPIMPRSRTGRTNAAWIALTTGNC